MVIISVPSSAETYKMRAELLDVIEKGNAEWSTSADETHQIQTGNAPSIDPLPLRHRVRNGSTLPMKKEFYKGLDGAKIAARMLPNSSAQAQSSLATTIASV